MAIRVPGGHAEISFLYKTPGLDTGMQVSLTGLALYAVYLLILFGISRRRMQQPIPSEIPESLCEDQPAEDSEHFAQSVQLPMPGEFAPSPQENTDQSKENS